MKVCPHCTARLYLEGRALLDVLMELEGDLDAKIAPEADDEGNLSRL